MKAFTLIALVITTALAYGQRIEELGKDLGKQLLAGLINKTATQSIDADLNKLSEKLNKGQTFSFPDGAVIGFEVRSNQTRFDDEKLIAALKGQVRHWGENLKIGPSFSDRERLREQNGADRHNPELRNPTPKGQAERPVFDVIVTAREADGFQGFGGSLSNVVRRLFGRSTYFEHYRETRYLEVSVEFKESASQTADAENGVFTAIGASAERESLRFDQGSFGFRKENGGNSDADLQSAVSRLTKAIAGNRKK